MEVRGGNGEGIWADWMALEHVSSVTICSTRVIILLTSRLCCGNLNDSDPVHEG